MASAVLLYVAAIQSTVHASSPEAMEMAHILERQALLPVKPEDTGWISERIGHDSRLRNKVFAATERLLNRGRQVHEGIADRIMLITHQPPEMQSATAGLINRKFRPAGIRTVALINEMWNVTDSSYANAVDEYRYSQWGELRNVPVAKEVILAGGFDRACLAQTVRDTVNASARKGLSQLKLRFLWQHMFYDKSVRNLSDIMKDLSSFPSGEIETVLRTTVLREVRVRSMTVTKTENESGPVLQARISALDVRGRPMRLELSVEGTPGAPESGEPPAPQTLR